MERVRWIGTQRAGAARAGARNGGSCDAGAGAGTAAETGAGSDADGVVFDTTGRREHDDVVDGVHALDKGAVVDVSADVVEGVLLTHTGWNERIVWVGWVDTDLF